MRRAFLITVAATALLNFGCMEKKVESNSAIFPNGELLSSDIITGKSWHNLLVEHDTTFSTVVGNEHFEAGSRNIWHSHPGGQIIIITDGVGYHQIKGQQVQVVRKGDVVKCPPDIVHWHGASKDSDVSQIYILPNSEKGIVKWFDRVTDEEYNNVQGK